MMEIDKWLVVDINSLALLIATTISVSKGIYDTFNIKNKFLTTGLVFSYLYLGSLIMNGIIFKDTNFSFYFAIVNTFVVGFFGSSGIYNFIKPTLIDKVKIQEEQRIESLFNNLKPNYQKEVVNNLIDIGQEQGTFVQHPQDKK